MINDLIVSGHDAIAVAGGRDADLSQTHSRNSPSRTSTEAPLNPHAMAAPP